MNLGRCDSQSLNYDACLMTMFKICISFDSAVVEKRKYNAKEW